MRGDTLLQLALGLAGAPSVPEATRVFGLEFVLEDPDDPSEGEAVVGEGFFSKAELGMNLWSQSGLLILRARSSPPVHRNELALERYGTLAPKLDPEGTTIYDFVVRGLALSFEFTRDSDHLLAAFVEWPALHRRSPFGGAEVV